MVDDESGRGLTYDQARQTEQRPVKFEPELQISRFKRALMVSPIQSSCAGMLVKTTLVRALPSVAFEKDNLKNCSPVAMFSPNHVDFPVTVWAAHRLGAIISYVTLFASRSKVANPLQACEPFVLCGRIGIPVEHDKT